MLTEEEQLNWNQLADARSQQRTVARVGERITNAWDNSGLERSEQLVFPLADEGEVDAENAEVGTGCGDAPGGAETPERPRAATRMSFSEGLATHSRPYWLDQLHPEHQRWCPGLLWPQPCSPPHTQSHFAYGAMRRCG